MSRTVLKASAIALLVGGLTFGAGHAAVAATELSGQAQSCSKFVVLGSTGKGHIYHYVNSAISPSAHWNNGGTYVTRTSNHGTSISSWRVLAVGAGGDVRNAGALCQFL